MSFLRNMAALAAAMVLTLPAWAQDTRSFTDDAGRTVEIPTHPQAIASLHDLSITVPLAMPGIVSGIILVFIPALGTFLISDLLGGTDSLLIGNVIERQFKAANHWPLGAAMSFVLLYITFAILALRAWLTAREEARARS